MKTELKNIMQTAWQFFKQTGLTFSECLKKAWANFKLKKLMQSQIIEFYYKKTNGEIRQAFGRLYDIPAVKGVRQNNDNLFTYYDTVAEGWRSFYKFNLVA